MKMKIRNFEDQQRKSQEKVVKHKLNEKDYSRMKSKILLQKIILEEEFEN